ncbi:class I SAM-dependent methyltransferase [Geodermatophilus sabuli]|uniref:Methyltransferase domain-containing protein n=1 Tax=Geodermatophilus sabuli TaxID=1564158 RepID=A0A285E9D2_9ACTN|nr:class I SAM-dependent methyltransferase [Geodermatophilus sabuli]MBB3082459.1 SAM-dependent methyltransferase [Geodermatophilus sabuli]SNX94671.1 Methyltransferase domain-containing protein [Geodermatophilus sabuli]
MTSQAANQNRARIPPAKSEGKRLVDDHPVKVQHDQVPGAPESLTTFYRDFDESGRLTHGHGLVEFRRTQALLRRHLPPPPARVLDVGGGPGVHATWLADDGYDVLLLDPVEQHVARATALAAGRFTARTGDARSLDRAPGTVDAVLLLGPLYHLPDPADRATALREAVRSARPGGLVAVAAISRVGGGAVDAVRRDLLAEPAVRSAVHDVLNTGWTRLAPAFYFHTPDELGAELLAADLLDVRVHGLEGPAWALVPDHAGSSDPIVTTVADLADLADADPMTVGASSHLLAIGHTSSSGSVQLQAQ